MQFSQLAEGTTSAAFDFGDGALVVFVIGVLREMKCAA